MSTTERRRYFRINDTVGLSYTLLDSHRHGNAHLVEITAAHVLAQIDHDLNKVINALWRETPTVAKAIGLLNRKIEVLTDEIIGDDRITPMERDQQMTDVSISGCGMAFDSEVELAVDQRLELFLTLKPSNTHITIHGSVVACDATQDSEKPYRLRIEFAESDAAAQEQLIQHIVQRQFAQRA